MTRKRADLSRQFYVVSVLLQISLNLIDKGLLYAPDPGQHETIGLIPLPGP